MALLTNCGHISFVETLCMVSTEVGKGCSGASDMALTLPARGGGAGSLYQLTTETPRV